MENGQGQEMPEEGLLGILEPWPTLNMCSCESQGRVPSVG